MFVPPVPPRRSPPPRCGTFLLRFTSSRSPSCLAARPPVSYSESGVWRYSSRHSLPRPVGSGSSQRATILPPATTAPASSPPASLPAPIRQARLTDSSSSATPFQSKKAGAPNLETPAKNPGLSHLAQEAPSVTASGDRETVSSLVHAVPLGKRVDYTRLYLGTPCQ